MFDMGLSVVCLISVAVMSCCFIQIKVEPSLDPLLTNDPLSKAKQSRSEKKARKAFAKLGECYFHPDVH